MTALLSYGDLTTTGAGSTSTITKNTAKHIDAATPPTVPQVSYKPTPQPLHIKVLNNPGAMGTDFKLLVEGGSIEDVHISVTDMAGRPVLVIKGATNQTYNFGRQFISGMYIVSVVQGKEIQTLKIVKGE